MEQPKKDLENIIGRLVNHLLGHSIEANEANRLLAMARIELPDGFTLVDSPVIELYKDEIQLVFKVLFPNGQIVKIKIVLC